MSFPQQYLTLEDGKKKKIGVREINDAKMVRWNLDVAGFCWIIWDINCEIVYDMVCSYIELRKWGTLAKKNVVVV